MKKLCTPVEISQIYVVHIPFVHNIILYNSTRRQIKIKSIKSKLITMLLRITFVFGLCLAWLGLACAITLRVLSNFIML